jgi:hypothetical protein
MPAFSRRNREKFMLTENVGFRSCERVVGQATYSSDKTLHRLGQIMPLVSETVNNVELTRRELVSPCVKLVLQRLLPVRCRLLKVWTAPRICLESSINRLKFYVDAATTRAVTGVLIYA